MKTRPTPYRATAMSSLGALFAIALFGCGPAVDDAGASAAPDPAARQGTRVLGLGSQTWQGGTQVVALSAGTAHTCAIFDAGGLKCWGLNDRRQLGHSVDPSLNGTAATPQMVATLGAGVADVATGSQHTCALLEQGWVKCWGFNLNNELGRFADDGNFAVISDAVVEDLGAGVVELQSAEGTTCARFDEGAIRCWPLSSAEPGAERAFGDNIGDRDEGMANLLGISAAPVGFEYTGGGGCLWYANGRAQCWGMASAPQMGGVLRDIGGWHEGVTEVTVGTSTPNGNHMCAIRGEDVSCLGVNIDGELGDGTNERSNVSTNVIGLRGVPVELVSGIHFTCARMQEGAVYCWGRNDDGQLGDGTLTTSPLPVEVAGLSGPATQIVAGDRHVCALIDDGSVQCWGANDSLEVGVEGDADIPTPTAPAGLLEF